MHDLGLISVVYILAPAELDYWIILFFYFVAVLCIASSIHDALPNIGSEALHIVSFSYL
jgi:hypothetical protein